MDLGIGKGGASFGSKIFADRMMVSHMHGNINVTTVEPDLIVRIVADGGAVTVGALVQRFANSRFRRPVQGQQCQESDRFHCRCWVVYDQLIACERRKRNSSVLAFCTSTPANLAN